MVLCHLWLYFPVRGPKWTWFKMYFCASRQERIPLWEGSDGWPEQRLPHHPHQPPGPADTRHVGLHAILRIILKDDIQKQHRRHLSKTQTKFNDNTDDIQTWHRQNLNKTQTQTAFIYSRDKIKAKYKRYSKHITDEIKAKHRQHSNTAPTAFKIQHYVKHNTQTTFKYCLEGIKAKRWWLSINKFFNEISWKGGDMERINFPPSQKCGYFYIFGWCVR